MPEVAPEHRLAAAPAQRLRLTFRTVTGLPGSLVPHGWQAIVSPGGSLRRLLALAWPSALEQLQRTFVGLADIYIVGQLGAAALTGVGLSGQALTLGIVALAAVGLGATVLVGLSVGGARGETANRVLGQAMLVAFTVGLIAGGLAFWIVSPLLKLLGAAPEVVGIGTVWIRTAAPAFVFNSVLLVGSAALRGAGDTRTPLLVVLGANALDLTLSWGLTHGHLGLPKLGVMGNAAAAAAGQTAGGLVMLWLLWRGTSGLRLRWQYLRPDGRHMLRLFRVGVPAGMELILLQPVYSALAAMLAHLSSAAFSANQISSWVAALAYLPGWGISVAVTTMVSQALGAERPDEARAIVGLAWWVTLAVMAALGVALYFLALPIMQLFSRDPDVIRGGRDAIQMAAFIQPAMAAAYVYSGALIGAGDTRTTTLISVACTWCLRLTVAYVAAVLWRWGVVGVWLGIGAEYAGRAAWGWLRFRSNKWQGLLR